MALKSLSVGDILSDKQNILYIICEVGLLGDKEYFLVVEMHTGKRLGKPLPMDGLLAQVNEKEMSLKAPNLRDYELELRPTTYQVVITELRSHTLQVPAPSPEEALMLVKADPKAFIPKGSCGESTGKFLTDDAYVIPF